VNPLVPVFSLLKEWVHQGALRFLLLLISQNLQLKIIEVLIHPDAPKLGKTMFSAGKEGRGAPYG